MSKWDEKSPVDIMADFNALVKSFSTFQPPHMMIMPYTQYRWLVRGRIVAMLSKKRRNRPAFANALRHA